MCKRCPECNREILPENGEGWYVLDVHKYFCNEQCYTLWHWKREDLDALEGTEASNDVPLV